MIEIVWSHDPRAGVREEQPSNAAQARARLEAGNAAFARVTAAGGRHVVQLPADALGLPGEDGGVHQDPFAAVLGCADARVPAELVFGQAANDLFVVRVAGNVPGTECLGSLDYAAAHLDSLRLIAVVGHTACGAVTAAVDAFLTPETYFEVARNHDLRAIVDAVMAAVTTAADAIADVHGPESVARPDHRAALVDTAVVVNAALTAALVRGQLHQGDAHRPGTDTEIGVAFGVYDLTHRSVGLPSAEGWRPGLADPPEGAAALAAIARTAAAAALGEA